MKLQKEQAGRDFKKCFKDRGTSEIAIQTAFHKEQ
jgi:hypothetical protein